MFIEIVKIAVVSYVLWLIMSPGMILSFWLRWITALPAWLYKPLGGCLYCMSGQIALWYYLIAHFKSYNPIDHLVTICGVILLTLAFDKYVPYENH